jgi:hypothetical protein
MGDCCSGSAAGNGSKAACPRCGRPGRDVERVTLKALLRPPALERLDPGEYRFCPTPDCPTVYFGATADFQRQDVTVPVFQKERHGERTVCYCFDIGEANLRREALNGTRGSAFARITRLVKEGRCACEFRNPQGACCLGNISLVSNTVQAPSTESVKAGDVV